VARALDQFDVLLRHRLLREAGGFRCKPALSAVFPLDELALADRNDARDREAGFHAASSRTDTESAERGSPYSSGPGRPARLTTMKIPKSKMPPPTSMPTRTLCNTRPVATPITTASAMNPITRPMDVCTPAAAPPSWAPPSSLRVTSPTQYPAGSGVGVSVSRRAAQNERPFAYTV